VQQPICGNQLTSFYTPGNVAYSRPWLHRAALPAVPILETTNRARSAEPDQTRRLSPHGSSRRRRRAADHAARRQLERALSPHREDLRRQPLDEPERAFARLFGASTAALNSSTTFSTLQMRFSVTPATSDARASSPNGLAHVTSPADRPSGSRR
jgi:hypothetical protein